MGYGNERHADGVRRTLFVLAALVGAVAVPLSPAHGQEIALVHDQGSSIRLAGTPVREFAAGLGMETISGEEGAFPDRCFVAVVDSEGNVWEEYASEPFQSERGELDGACVPRSPLTPEGVFPDAATAVRFEAPLGADMFTGGLVDWVSAIKPLDKAVPRLEQEVRHLQRAGRAGLEPPPHLEGVEYGWVALFFMVGPSEERTDRKARGFDHWPIMILVGAG